MEAKLIINNVDFSGWIVEDGLSYSEIYRQGRDVTVLDGTLYRSQIKKYGIDVDLVEMRSSTLAVLKQALIQSPATVQFTAPTGDTLTRSMYISDQSEGVKTVRGGNTYYSGISFALEEM